MKIPLDEVRTVQKAIAPIRKGVQFYKGASMIYDCYEPQIDDARESVDDYRTQYRRARRLYQLLR